MCFSKGKESEGYYKELLAIYDGNKVALEKNDINTEKIKRIYQYVDDIETTNKKLTLCAMICEFEGKTNDVSFYSICGLAYSLIVLFASFLFQVFTPEKPELPEYIVICPLIFMIVVLFILAIYAKNKTAKRTFILNALRFKYAELYSNEETNYRLKKGRIKITKLHRTNGARVEKKMQRRRFCSKLCLTISKILFEQDEARERK